MKLEFRPKRLALIQTDRAHELKLPFAVIKASREKLRFLADAPDERTLRNWRSLYLKKRDDIEPGLMQIKINDQYRMRFLIDTSQKPPLLTVVFLGDDH
jgi:proteic killer suppression protein